ncbi:hypothetical protein ACHAQI_006066 [Fusarium lateritium]
MNEGGILGYLEIQEILKKHKVSYDDKATFEQKVKWADSIGLGGLMIWAVDLDDSDFTALSGLIGKSVQKGVNKLPSISERYGKSWSSETGQDCWVTDCGTYCPLTDVIVKTYDSTCGKDETRSVCCPRDCAPEKCMWRGGESGNACYGQCHAGELIMTFDRNGDKWCSSGEQVLCCTSSRFEALLDGCELGDCGGDCPSGTHDVAKQTCGGRFSIKKAPWCCKKKLESCHWVGKGGCDQNNCAGGVLPYTPVPLESIFPEVPPEDSSIKYDLQILGGFTGSGAETTHENTNNNPAFAPFGFVLIAGPKDAVSSISKRDDSHIEVVDCSGITLSGSQSVRIFCSNDNDESNSDDMLDGGLEGTVLRMPDNCGPATYVIAQSLKVSEDQSLPGHLVKRKPDNREVLDLIFHYDFKRVKRSDEKIYMRVDWSTTYLSFTCLPYAGNVAGYWDEIVAASPDENSKRSLDPRHLGQRGLDKRFFSDDSAEWSRKFESLRDTRFWTDFSSPATTVLLNDEVKCDDGGFLQIEAKTKSKVYAKFGFTMIGTLYPFNFDSVYGFLDTWYDIDVEVSVTGFSGLDINQQPKAGEDTETQDMAYMQPGLVNLVPNFNIYFGLEADDAEFTADFKTEFSIKSDPDSNRGWVRRTFPSTVGKSSGAALLDSTHFQGGLKTTKGSAEISIRPQFNIGLEVEATGASDLKRDVGNLERRQGVSGAKYDISLYLPVALILKAKGLYKENKGLHYGMYATAGDAFGNWGSEPTNGELMGKASNPTLVHRVDESPRTPSSID